MFGFILGRTADMGRLFPGRNLIYPGEKSHVVWCCPAGHDNSEILGFLPGRNPICVDFSWGEMRTCCTSPGEKVAGVAFQLGKNSHMFDLSPGEINFRHLWISPRGKSDMQIIPGRNSGHVAFLPGRNLHLSDFSRGDISTCHISPGEKFIFCLMYHQDTPTSKYVPCVRGTIQVIWSKSFIDK